ncbi:MAG: 2-oxo acid dehydrogenase subunit E2 [Jhaorihella sp.]
MTSVIEICVPDIGDLRDVPIIDMPIAVGDEIGADDTLIVVESDKATLDVPSTHAGRIVEILVEMGGVVSAGTPVARIEVAEAEASAGIPVAKPDPVITSEEPVPTAGGAAPAMPAPAKAGNVPVAAPPVGAAMPGKPVYASPSIRRYARVLGVTLSEVTGTGPKARILREDVEAFVKARLTDSTVAPAGQTTPLLAGLPEWPREAYEKFGPVERLPLSRIVRLSGPALARNALVIPHVCNFDKADVTEIEAFRTILNAEAEPGEPRITMLAFAVKAVVSALKAHPKFNSSLDGDDLVLRRYWNIGVAADTPEGLVVPVVKAADQKSVTEIAAEMSDLATRARAGKLLPDAMSGATFTISSLGGIGGTGFTPIINAPQVAILGMARAEVQPVWKDDGVEPRLIQPLSLSWDHRAVDGVAAARFLRHIAQVLADFRRVSI